MKVFVAPINRRMAISSRRANNVSLIVLAMIHGGRREDKADPDGDQLNGPDDRGQSIDPFLIIIHLLDPASTDAFGPAFDGSR
jgi:hypothetical protein